MDYLWRHIVDFYNALDRVTNYTAIYIIGVVALGAGIVLVAALVKKQQQREQANTKNDLSELKERLLIQARNFAADMQQNRALPTVATNIILKPGESAFYSSPSALYETRAVRQYQSGFTGFRVARGVYIGGSKGRSMSTQEWARIDTGQLTITNQRLVFDGGKQDRTIPLSKIVSVDSSLTAIYVSAEGRQKTMVFDAANPMIAAAVIRVCRHVTDPLNLSDYSKIDLQFE